MTESNPIPVTYVVRRFMHHSPHSGYDMLIPRVPGARTVEPKAGAKWELLTLAIWRQLLKGRSPMPYYSPEGLRVEAAFARDALWHRRGFYHFLYGDNHYWLAARLRKLAGVKLLATFHLPPELLPASSVAGPWLDRLEAVIVMGQSQLPYFTQRMGADRVAWIPYGVDVDYFCPAARQPRQRRLCLIVGDWMRDFETLHKVIDQFNRAGKFAADFVVVTPERNYPYLTGCANTMLRQGVPEPELRALYQQADLLLLPLKGATANTALVESMACGTPAVVSDVGDVRDYLCPEGARFIPPNDVDGFVSAVEQLLSDEPMRERMGTAARERAMSFAWPLIAAKTMEFYRRMQL